jgi:ribosomal protein S18 acetylase RimI-like enzyme
MPKVPPPCGGNVSAAQPKAASAPKGPAVPAPCGGNVGAVQPKAANAPKMPAVPPPAGGNVGAQPKVTGAVQRKAGPVHIASQGSKFVARAEGAEVGSVELRQKGGAVELVNLGVDAQHRKAGVGKQLIAQALSAGLGGGKGLVTLESQDDGSGKLTRWYESMGFTRVGTSDRRLAVMQAPISTVRAAVAQGKMAEESEDARPGAPGGRRS